MSNNFPTKSCAKKDKVLGDLKTELNFNLFCSNRRLLISKKYCIIPVQVRRALLSRGEGSCTPAAHTAGQCTCTERAQSKAQRDYYWKRPILCLASSKILNWPPTLSLPGECVSPPLLRGEDTLAGWRRGWGVNILEDARYCPVLYLYKYFVYRSQCECRKLPKLSGAVIN